MDRDRSQFLKIFDQFIHSFRIIDRAGNIDFWSWDQIDHYSVMTEDIENLGNKTWGMKHPVGVDIQGVNIVFGGNRHCSSV